MSGPLRLCEEDIATLEVRPGVYVLGRACDGNAQGLYVGRSDSSLRDRLRDHLPGRETSIRIQILAPDCFWYTYTATPYEAFRIECQLYHAHRYLCNVVHPPGVPDGAWECPVCARSSRIEEEPPGATGFRAVA